MEFDWLGIGTFWDRNETQGAESFFDFSLKSRQERAMNNMMSFKNKKKNLYKDTHKKETKQKLNDKQYF